MNVLQRNRGFTLLELLVAISIFAIVSAIAYGGLTQMLQSRDRVEAEREFWRGLSMTFWRLDEDLAQARLRGVRDTNGDPLPAFRGQPVDTRALAKPSLEFTRGGVPILGPAQSDLQRVAYRLADGTLYRVTWPVLDRAPQTKPVESPLIGDVTDLKLRFYLSADQRTDIWPIPPAPGSVTPPSDALPRAVEITLTFGHHGTFSRLFLVGP